MTEERRDGLQRRSFWRFVRLGDKGIGRRLEDFEFSLFLKMGIVTLILLSICLVAVFYIK